MKQIKLITITLILCMFVGGASAGITYNAGTDLITITGYTEASPCTFDDIYNADVAGGWGVIQKMGSDQYYITTRLCIGDGTTSTWVADTGKHVVIEAVQYPYHWGYMIRIRINAHLRLGNVISHTNKTTDDGCCLKFISSGVGLILGEQYMYGNSGTLELYSSQILYNMTGSDSGYIYKLYNTIIYNTIFAKDVMCNRLYDVEIYNLNINNARYGMVMVTGNISDVTCSNMRDYGIHFNTNIHSDLTMRNCNFINSDLGEGQYYYVYNMFLIDVTSDRWVFGYYSFNNGQIYRQYTFNIQTTSNAEITIMNHRDIVYQDYAYDNGTIDEQILTMGHYRQSSGSTINSQNPYSIEIKKMGYHTYAQEFTLNEPIVWHIMLLPDRVQVGSNIIRPARRS